MLYLIRFCFLFSNFLGGVTRTHCGLRFDHVLRTLAAAAVLHGIAGLLVEDDAEEEDERALEGGEQVGERVSKTKRPGNPSQAASLTSCRTNLQAVEPGKQIVEDDNVAVHRQESHKARD